MTKLELAHLFIVVQGIILILFSFVVSNTATGPSARFLTNVFFKIIPFFMGLIGLIIGLKFMGII